MNEQEEFYSLFNNSFQQAEQNINLEEQKDEALEEQKEQDLEEQEDLKEQKDLKEQEDLEEVEFLDDEQEEVEFNLHDNYFNLQTEEEDEKLYNGSNLTNRFTITLLLFLIINFNIPKSKINLLLKIIACFLPRENNLLRTKKDLFKQVNNINDMKKIYVYDRCSITNTTSKCSKCLQSLENYFYYNSLQNQLKVLLEKLDFREKIKFYTESYKENTKCYQDVYDRNNFKHGKSILGVNFILLNFNCD
ncbi:hypothetical protein ABK040_004412 [Willaertia magna]